MNRLQKKCLIVSASCHGLLLLVLLVGPAFFISRDNVESGRLLNMFSGRVVDNAESSGGTPNVSQAPPAAPNRPTPVEPPKNDPPKVVEPARLPPQPKPIDRPKSTPTQDFTPVERQKPAPVKHQPDEFTMVSHPPTKLPQANPNSSANKRTTDTKSTQAPDNSRQLAALMRDVNGLKSGLSPGAKIEFNAQGGDSDEVVANYGDIVYSKYYYGWTPPTSSLKSGIVTVRVTIARSGRVTHSEIITRSGDAAMDRSIQNTLDNVTMIEPFPANSRDLERTFTIEFDLAAKRSL